MFNKTWLLPVALIILIAGINIARFINLDGAPNGFMFDEETSGVTLQCLVEKGISPLNDTPYPLFGDVGIGSPKPPTYMYPGMAWVKIFGYSPAAIRSLTVFVFVIALFGLFAIGRLFGGTTCGLWTMLAGTISPWTWTFTRVGWESPFVVTFFIWGIYFSLRARRSWEFIIAGLLLSAAAYTYPPARLHIPLFMALMSWYGVKFLDWNIKKISVLAASFFIASLPLALTILHDPAMATRFKYIAISNPDYLSKIGKTGSFFDLAGIVWKNFLLHISPDYLFFKGLPRDMGQSTGRQGILSWIDAIALIFAAGWAIRAWISRKPAATTRTWVWMGFLAVNILIGMVPSIMTWMEDPNTGNNLRSIGSWPFAMIATGLIIHKLSTLKPWAWIPAFLASLAFIVIFLYQYFTFYPKDSVWMFRKWSLEEAKSAKTDEDWMKFLFRHREDAFASRYFLMRYHGDNCVQARAIWEKTSPVFKKMAAGNKGK